MPNPGNKFPMYQKSCSVATSRFFIVLLSFSLYLVKNCFIALNRIDIGSAAWLIIYIKLLTTFQSHHLLVVVNYFKHC